MFEQHSILMKYKIDRMNFELADMRQQRSALGVGDSFRSEASGGDFGRDNLQSVRSNVAATPVANRPRESGCYLWEPLRRNRTTGGGICRRAGDRGSSFCARGDPGSEERQGRTHIGGDWMP